MAAAAIPAISLGAQFFANRGAKKRNDQALNTATTGLQGSATDLSGLGTKLGDTAGSFLGDAQKNFGRAGTALDQSQNYFSPLLAGSRGAIDQTLAPDRAMITDTYRGAGKALEQSGMRGGTRDLASAELNRDRAGKLALLGPAARANAATSMQGVSQQRAGMAGQQAGVGAGLFGQAVGAKGGAVPAYATLFSGANQRDLMQGQYNNQAGSAIGSMIFDAVKSRGSKGGGGAPGVGGASAFAGMAGGKAG